MDIHVFSNISKIIERESKATTYKFALLRGVIDIIQDNSPYITFEGDYVKFPTGLLIEKWILYYYPILQSRILIPQIHGESPLAFEKNFLKIIQTYNSQGGLSAFYSDLKNNRIPEFIKPDLKSLIQVLKKTITGMPMRYIGRSISNEYYSIFKHQNQKSSNKSHSINLQELILNYGTFHIPLEYYEAFKILGSFINGQDSILFKWAEFSVNASRDNLRIENVVNEILKSPITEREIAESKKIYTEMLGREENIQCVWTGKHLTTYDIDHLIPFSVWKNNDLWNLLPSDSKTNSQKRNKIPSPNLIEKRKDVIINYWEIIKSNQNDRFETEMKISLLGEKPIYDWKKLGIEQLKNTCHYLINSRGFEEWRIYSD